jgi:tetratricopeptide (TPR) repeat protein
MKKDKNLIKLIRSLEVLILEYKFDEASQLLVNVDQLTIASAIHTLGHEKPGVLAYVFVSYLIKNEEKAIYHYAASLLMSYAFNYLPGAYWAAYYHSKRALELDSSNIQFKTSLLYLRDIPEKILGKEEAIQIAKEILNEKPDSESALRILIWETTDSKAYIEKALSYNPDNVTVKEMILLYYSKLRDIVPKEQALQLAADVLKHYPKSDAAQRVIKELT